jgi:catechol 2,3-dioxygenase-like lactoylglutathione lyase family enzyme
VRRRSAASVRPGFKGVNHVAFTVTDLDVSQRFYTDVLGFLAVLDVGDVRVLMHQRLRAVGLDCSPLQDTPLGHHLNVRGRAAGHRRADGRRRSPRPTRG